MRSKKAELFPIIEKFVDDFREEYNISPSVQQIADHIGLSKPMTSRYLAEMRERGEISMDGQRNISTRETKRTRAETIRVPVLGSVSCGVPKFAEENIEEYIRLPVALFGRWDFYILRANGDSMIEANICDGDFVVIRQQNHANDGQIVVALMEEEATLKRYYPEPHNHRIRLHPENKTMCDIYVDDCVIQGVAVKVLKDLE